MKSPLPTYSIYGEQGRTQDVEWLHCESIAERSQLHDWEIRAHQHELLMQLFWVERGACVASLDAVEHAVKGPCVMLIPPLAAHGFRFQPGVRGQVVTVLAQHARKLLADQPGLEQRLMRPAVQGLDKAQAARIAAGVQALQTEFASADSWRSMAVDGALVSLLVTLGRCLPGDPGTPSPQATRAFHHGKRYQGLIEQQYRQQPAVSRCAEALGITATQLNRVCQQVLGCSAIALLHARLLLEAQRELAYTTMSIKQIADGLGFADAAYFTRFFQRKTGLSPSLWRARSAAHLR